MRFGLYVANFGEAAYARTLADLAVTAERIGWDGFFLWDSVSGENRRLPTVDTFTALSAMAVNTKRIRLGATVTALARRRPWKVARETVTIDHLSNGRLTLGVGLGDPAVYDFEYFGESADEHLRAEKLDEALDILVGLWSGKPFSYRGKHYTVNRIAFLPATKQRPRIPIWVGGFWPNRAPFRRAARWDGTIPLKLRRGIPFAQPDDIREIVAYISKYRKGTGPFDVVVIGGGTGRDRARDAKKIGPYVDAGATWWLESLYILRNSPERMRARIRRGPPRI